MELCDNCVKQATKLKRGSPHPDLETVGDVRIFGSINGYREQDYQCVVCQTKFSFSTNRNDFAWTIWRS